MTMIEEPNRWAMFLTSGKGHAKLRTGMWWEVHCKTAAMPWASVRNGAAPGELTNFKFVKTKAEARKLLLYIEEHC
jgi:hypothetical protein